MKTHVVNADLAQTACGGVCKSQGRGGLESVAYSCCSDRVPAGRPDAERLKSSADLVANYLEASKSRSRPADWQAVSWVWRTSRGLGAKVSKCVELPVHPGGKRSAVSCCLSVSPFSSFVIGLRLGGCNWGAVSADARVDAGLISCLFIPDHNVLKWLALSVNAFRVVVMVFPSFEMTVRPVDLYFPLWPSLLL